MSDKRTSIYKSQDKIKMSINNEEIEIKIKPYRDYRNEFRKVYDENKAWDLEDKLENLAFDNMEKIRKNSDKMIEAVLAYMKVSIMESQEQVKDLFNKLISEKNN